MNPNIPIPEELKRMVECQLSGGERVTWLGQPLAGRCARKGLFPLLLGIPFTIFSIYIVGGDGGLVMFPIIVTGLVMFSVPFWMHRKARRTFYVLTNRRAILLSVGWRGKVSERSFWPHNLNQVKRKQKPDGSGDLVLGQDLHKDSEGYESLIDVGFLAVPEVKSVEDKLISLLIEKVS